VARLVAWQERVAKRFDDVIGRHAQMRHATLEHAEHRRDDTPYRPERLGSAPVEGRRRREEVAEEPERPVDQMNDHGRNDNLIEWLACASRVANRFRSSGTRRPGHARRFWSACRTTARNPCPTSPATTIASPGSKPSPTGSPTPSWAI